MLTPDSTIFLNGESRHKMRAIKGKARGYDYSKRLLRGFTGRHAITKYSIYEVENLRMNSIANYWLQNALMSE